MNDRPGAGFSGATCIAAAGPKARRPRLTTALALMVLAPFAGLALARTAAAYVKPSAADSGVEPITVAATPIDHFSRLSSGATFGKLVFRGGLVLSSPSPSFGGWSGAVLDVKGSNLVAVSDAGAWMTARIAYDEKLRPAGLENARLGPLKALSAKSLRKNRDRDAEAVAIESGTLDKGSLLIAFEANHRIGRFRIDRDGVSAPLGYIAMPAELKGARKRDGLEAMTVVAGGRSKGALVGMAESFKNSAGDHTGWLWPASGGEPKRFNIEDLGEFAITDVASLANGDLIVLERRFRWLEGVRMRLRRIAADEVRPAARIKGEVLIEADMSHEIDNMEGLAVHVDERGATVLTLLSDDNFNGFLQRTLLLQFTLIDAPLRASR